MIPEILIPPIVGIGGAIGGLKEKADETRQAFDVTNPDGIFQKYITYVGLFILLLVGILGLVLPDALGTVKGVL